jgi:hypothetical protein
MDSYNFYRTSRVSMTRTFARLPPSHDELCICGSCTIFVRCAVVDRCRSWRREVDIFLQCCAYDRLLQTSLMLPRLLGLRADAADDELLLLEPWHRFVVVVPQKVVHFRLTMRDAYVTLEFECPICYESMDSESYAFMPCKHVFHRTCLERWRLTQRNSFVPCAVCKRVFMHSRLSGGFVCWSRLYPTMQRAILS